MTAREMLEIWGLRIKGGAFTSYQPASGHVMSSMDDASEAVAYVEATQGFRAARPMLIHVFAEGCKLSSFAWRDPGTGLEDQLDALGWDQCYDFPPSQWAGSVFRGFVWRLDRRLLKAPFVPTSRRTAVESEEVGCDADRPITVPICSECAELNGGRPADAVSTSRWVGVCCLCGRERSVGDIGAWAGLRVNLSQITGLVR